MFQIHLNTFGKIMLNQPHTNYSQTAQETNIFHNIFFKKPSVWDRQVFFPQ